MRRSRTRLGGESPPETSQERSYHIIELEFHSLLSIHNEQMTSLKSKAMTLHQLNSTALGDVVYQMMGQRCCNDAINLPSLVTCLASNIMSLNVVVYSPCKCAITEPVHCSHIAASHTRTTKQNTEPTVHTKLQFRGNLQLASLGELVTHDLGEVVPDSPGHQVPAMSSPITTIEGALTCTLAFVPSVPDSNNDFL